MSRTLFVVQLAFLVACALPRACLCQEYKPPTLDEEFAEELDESANITGSWWATALLIMEVLEASYQIHMYFTVYAVKREHELQGVHASYGEWTLKRVRWEKRAAVSIPDSDLSEQGLVKCMYMLVCMSTDIFCSANMFCLLWSDSNSGAGVEVLLTHSQLLPHVDSVPVDCHKKCTLPA
jgi:hypothetical protein